MLLFGKAKMQAPHPNQKSPSEIITAEMLGDLPTGLLKLSPTADFTLREALTDWFLMRNGPFTDYNYGANTVLVALAKAITKQSIKHGRS